METCHLSAGAATTWPIVREDDDRYDLVRRMEDALGALVLAYCVMDTHIHVVAEGPAEHLVRWLDAALALYARDFNARHAPCELLLRGDTFVRPVAPDAFELARAISYVHDNPVKAGTCARATEFPWSSARAFAGLSLATTANVARAIELLGPCAARALHPADRIALASPTPAPHPSASPPVLLAAAAQVYGLPPAALPSTSRAEVLSRARALYLKLGEVEAYTQAELAPYLGRSQSQCSRLAAARPAADLAVAMARTLLAHPGLRRWLKPPIQMHEIHASEALPRAEGR